MSNDMPERIWIDPYDGSQILQLQPDSTEYIRADLVPKWHDKPTCEGLWMQDGEVHGIKWYGGNLSYYTCGEWYKASGGWFGPIPEDNE